MTHEDFSILMDDITDHLRQTMASKNAEYAPGDDKLANFKKSSRMTGKSVQECLWMFCVKHLVSVQDIVQGESNYTPELLREKCGDIRAYTCLLEACMMEQNA